MECILQQQRQLALQQAQAGPPIGDPLWMTLDSTNQLADHIADALEAARGYTEGRLN